MSSFKIKAKHKKLEVEHEIWCLDDYFGKYKYGYVPHIADAVALTEKEFYKIYDYNEPL